MTCPHPDFSAPITSQFGSTRAIAGHDCIGSAQLHMLLNQTHTSFSRQDMTTKHRKLCPCSQWLPAGLVRGRVSWVAGRGSAGLTRNWLADPPMRKDQNLADPSITVELQEHLGKLFASVRGQSDHSAPSCTGHQGQVNESLGVDQCHTHSARETDGSALDIRGAMHDSIPVDGHCPISAPWDVRRKTTGTQDWAAWAAGKSTAN